MADADRYRQYAERIAIFNGLGADDVALVIRHGQILQFRQNQTIFHEGMLGSNLFIVLGGEVGIYNKAEYLDQRREMLQAWGSYVMALKDGAKVISISEAKSA